MINSNRWNRMRYTLWAPMYDRIVHFGAQRHRSIDLLELKRGERLLIVGGGTGADFPFIPDGVEVVAGDITPAMVERMQRRARQLGRNITTDVMDRQKLPIPDASFDAVVLHLIPRCDSGPECRAFAK